MSNFGRKSSKECFSSLENKFRATNQAAAAKMLGINAKNICVIGNCHCGETKHEDRVYIGTSYLGNPRYEYFFIYQKCLTRKHTKASLDEFLNGYIIPVRDLTRIFQSIKDNGRTITAPNQEGRFDILTYILYSEFDDTYKFMIK